MSSATTDLQDSPWRYPIFRAIWFANLLSQFGGMIQSVGAAWMMTSLGASPQIIALVQTSMTLPIMLMSLPAGAMADSLDRRWVMLAAQTCMLCTSAALAVCAGLGVLTPWMLLGFTFALGLAGALNIPSWQASVGDMVPRTALPNAVAMNSMGFNLARSLGPALGGMIVAAAGAAAAFMINSLTYFGLLFVLARWRPERPAQGARERLHHAVAAGIRYVAMSPNILRVLLRGSLFGFAASALPALMPVVARDLIGGGPLVFGALSGAFGVGAVTGAFFGGRLRRRFSTETILRGAGLSIVLGAAIIAFSHNQIITMAGFAFTGAGFILGLSTFNVTVQMASPRWVVGRALSVYQMATFGGMALGSGVFGGVTEHYGVSMGMLAAAGAQLASVAVGLVLPLPNAEALDLDLHGRWSEPQTTLPVEPRSGPVYVSITYRIPEDRLPTFTAAMVERGRIRKRDGAQGWRLMRDLAEPEIWVESYHAPTWADYVRHNQRGTNADIENGALLRSLHSGDTPPVVTRMLERQSAALPWGRGSAPQEPMTAETEHIS
jgi:MFS family permease